MNTILAPFLAVLFLLPQLGFSQLPAPTLFSPAHNAVGYQLSPSFTWSSISGAGKYRIQIAADSTFSTIVDEDVVEIARYVPATALYAANRFWRVRAVDAAGIEGAWSATFAYKLQIPATVVNITPTATWASTVNAAIASATTPLKIVFAPGTYTFTPASGTDTYAIKISAKQDIVIEGSNALIKLMATTAGGKHIIPGFSSVQNSQRVTLRRFQIEHDPIPHYVGIVKNIQQVGPRARVTLKTESGYPDLSSDIMQKHWSFGCVLDRFWNGRPVNTKKGRLKPDAGIIYSLDATSVAAAGTGMVAVTISSPGYASIISQVENEDPFIIFARESTADNPVGSIASNANCTDLVYEEVTAYTAPAGHFTASQCSDFKVLRCKGVGRSGRWFGGNADGVHCFANKTGPWIEGCEFSGIGDDAVALYNKGLMVKQKLSDTVVRIAPDNMYFSAGDQFKIFRALNGTLDAPVFIVGSVATNSAGGVVTSYDITFSPGVTGAFYTGGTTPEMAHHNDQLFSITERNAQFAIRNNTFGAVRRFGCAVRSAAGIITGNTFSGVSTSPLALMNEASSWRNGPYNYNVLISGNVFNDNGYDQTARNFANIQIEYHKVDPANQWGYLVSTAQEHGLISVVNNTFENWENKAILLSNAYASTVSNNTVNARRYPPLLPGVINQGITLGYTSGATVSGNMLINSGVPPSEALVVPSSTNTGATVTGNTLP